MTQQMMKAGMLEPSEHFGIHEIPIPEPDDDEILLHIHTCGVCMSEVGFWKLGPVTRGYPGEDVLDWEIEYADTPMHQREYPLLMGHEPSGEIVAVGQNVTHLMPGMRAVALGGRSFAEYGVYRAAYVQPIADSTPYNLALGEPIACAYNATQRAAVEEGETVVLIGCGFMGLMQLQMMKLANPEVIIAIDIRDDALEFAQKVGADVIINSAKEDVLQAVREVIGPKGANVVVEVVGKQPGLDLATQLVGFNGRIVVVGYHQGEPRTIDMALWNWKGIDIINGHERYPDVYHRGMIGGITLLEEGKLDMETLVTHVYPLDDIDAAFHDAANKPDGFVKAVVTPVAQLSGVNAGDGLPADRE